MILVNIQVELHKDDAGRVRDNKMSKREAIEVSVNHGHYTVIETIDEGKEND